MAYEIVMPALEMAQDTGRLLRWLKTEGEFVHKGQPLMEIETDKVTVEIEAPASGVLSALTAREGDDIPVGAVIGLLVATSDAKPVTNSMSVIKETAPRVEPKITPVAQRVAAAHGLNPAGIDSGAGRIRKQDVLDYAIPAAVGETVARLLPASPKARRLASERGLRLETVVGSGRDGAVIVRDLPSTPEVQATPPPVAVASPASDYRVVPMTGIRKTIASRLHASYQAAPHIALTLSADMTDVLRLRDRLASSADGKLTQTITVTAILVRIVAAALRQHSRLNAHIVDSEIREFEAVHLGVAVALDDGLIVPVLRDAAHKRLAEIDADLRDLGARARSGGLQPHEVKGSTFTISNLGMYGIEHFTAILNPPEVGILAVGAIVDRPVGVAGQIVLRPMMELTLNVDHRAVDGAVAAAFLKTLKTMLENPYLLL